MDAVCVCVSCECAGLSWDHEKILNFWVLWSRSPIAKINMTWTSQEIWGVLFWNILKQKSPKWMMRYGLEPWASSFFFFVGSSMMGDAYLISENPD